MAIIPTVRCRRMAASIAFYTGILDFEVADGDGDEPDPCFRVLKREGDLLFLSSHAGDGTFGQAVVILTPDVDSLFQKYRDRGLRISPRPDSPVHEGPVDQTWGSREFYVTDPDGNTLRFAELRQESE